MQIHAMETTLDNELLEGEELLWSGRPEARGKSVASPARVFSILGRIYFLIGVGLLILSLILLFLFYPSPPPEAFLGALIPGGIFFILGLIFLIIGSIVRSPNRNTLYAITNRRAIIFRTGRYLRVTSYSGRAITQVQRFERPDGSGDLIFSGIPLSYGGSYGNSNYDSYNTGRQGIFAAIPNVRQAEQKLLSITRDSR